MLPDATSTDTRLAADLDGGLRPLVRLLRRSHDAELSNTALSTLARLEDDGPQRITDLAEQERVAQPTMTALVKRLEGEGLVERIADRTDARVVRARVTAAGEARMRAVRSRRAELLARLLSELDTAERATLAAALPALARLSEIDRNAS